MLGDLADVDLGLVARWRDGDEQAWASVQAARELPATRRALDQILALAEDLIAELENAVRRAGHQPNPRLARDLRSTLDRPA